MYSTPPREDEHGQPGKVPQRHRREVVQPRQPPIEHHPDEHPEIPLIRRASRFIDQETLKIPAAPLGNEGTDEREQELTTAVRLHPPQRDASKILVVQRQHPPVHTPPPPARHTRQHARPKRSWQEQLVHLEHSQPVIIICSLLVVMLIMGMIIAANIGRSQTSSSSNGANPNPRSGQQHATPVVGIQGSSDPHELVITPQDTDHPPPPVYATAAYLLDADTGATLYAYHPFLHLPMMSTTKLMTAVLAVEQGKPDQKITITSAIAHDISQLSPGSTLFGLKKGETYTLREMLYGLLLLSGNDAAIAIAATIGGNLPHFVDEMNARAHQLGLYDTHYMNPHGLAETGNYSSAHDLAVLGQYSLSIPLIHQISGTETYIIPQTKDHPEHVLLNGSQFLWWYPGVDGGKTGYDGASNFVQVISCTRNHHHLIGVTIHTNNWWTDMRDLMNWGFDSFTWISPHDVDSVQNPIPYDYLWNYFASDKKDNTIPTADQGRYYIYTGFSVSGLIQTYFDKGGGLKQFGYPIGMPTIASPSLESQRFEQGSITCNIATKQCTII